MSVKKVVIILGALVIGLSILSFCVTFNVNTITPASPLYSLKIIKENLERSFAVTINTKIKRELEFSGRRIREVEALILQEREDYISTTLERYGDSLRRLEGFSLDGDAAKELIVGFVVEQPDSLIKLHGQAKTPEGRRAIRAALQRIVRHVTGLSSSLDEERTKKLQDVCTLFTNSSYDTSLNTAEIAYLNDLIEKCSNNIKGSR